MDHPELLVVGRVERPHGVAGEVSVSIRTHFPDRFVAGAAFLWQNGDAKRMLRVTTARPHLGRMLLRFEGVGDVSAARSLSGGDLCIESSEARPAPPGFFYEHEVVGWACEDRFHCREARDVPLPPGKEVVAMRRIGMWLERGWGQMQR